MSCNWWIIEAIRHYIYFRSIKLSRISIILSGWIFVVSQQTCQLETVVSFIGKFHIKSTHDLINSYFLEGRNIGRHFSSWSFIVLSERSEAWKATKKGKACFHPKEGSFSFYADYIRAYLENNMILIIRFH